jgi:hypothetical protein
MKWSNAWRFAAVLCMFATSTDASADPPGQPLGVTNSKPGVFGVVSHRMQPVGAGIVAAGLIGAAIQTGIESSEDGKMKNELLKRFPDASCNQPLLDAFNGRVRADGTFTVVGAANKNAATADLAIDECGFHLADTTANEFSSYVYLTLRFKPAATAAWSEKIQVSGRNRYGFDDLLNQPGLAQSELADALTRAGVRAADKIIYKR